MIQSGVGFSTASTGRTAADQAVAQAMGHAGIDRADFAVMFATPHYACEYTRMLNAVHTATGAPHIVGCSGMEVLTSIGEVEQSPGVAVLVGTSDGLHLSSFILPDADAASHLASELASSPPHDHTGSPLLMLFSDVMHIHPTSLLNAFGAALPGVQIVGAGASGSLEKMEAYQWAWRNGVETLNDCISHRGVSGLMIRGDFSPLIAVARSCRPLGESYVITSADGHLIREIANRPAMEILQESAASLKEAEKQHVERALVAGLVVDEEKYPLEIDDFVFRNIAGVEPSSGSLVISERVRVGQTIQFHIRDKNAARQDMERVLQDLSEKAAGKRIAMGFYFNCLARGAGFYGEFNHDTKVIRRYFPDVPIVGFLGNAEFAPVGGSSVLHNYTGVLVLVAEEVR